MRTAAIELAAKGITINAVHARQHRHRGAGRDRRRSTAPTMEASIPQRKLGTVEDIGNAALFFATDEAALHHRADARGRRRPGAARVADGARGAVALAPDPPLSLGPTARARAPRAPARAALPGPGERLGAERELAERLGVSRSTVRAALADLERGGVVRRTRGRAGGIFVAERKVERDLTSLAGLPAYLRRQGFQSDARVLRTATIEPDAGHAAALALRPDELVLEVVRVRLADGEPISLERACFPAERFPGLLDRSLAGSLYELLERELRAGARRGGGAHRGGRRAAPTEARLLGVRRGAPLLAIARTAWDRDGRAVRALSRPLPRRPRADRGARPLGARRANVGRRLGPRHVTLATRVAELVQFAKLVGQLGRPARIETRERMSKTQPVEVTHAGHRRVVLGRRVRGRPAQAERDRPVGGDLRRRDRRGADLGDAVQRAVRRRLRHRQVHAGGVPVRHDDPDDLHDRLRGDGAQDPRGGRLLLVHLPRPGARARAWPRASAARSPTRCSRCRCSAASPTSPTTTSTTGSAGTSRGRCSRSRR